MLLLALVSVVRADEGAVSLASGGFDAHGFVLGAHDGDVRDPLSLPRPGVLVPGAWFAGGVLEFADRPLVLVVKDATGEEVEPVLTNLLVANTSLGVAVHERVRLDVALPLALSSTGQEGWNGVDLGDMRVSAQILGTSPGVKGGFGLGVVPYLDLPTGAAREFLGDRTLGGGATLVGTWEAEGWTVSGATGLDLGPAVDAMNVNGADRWQLAGAFGWLADPSLGFTGELAVDVPLVAADAEPGTQTAAQLKLSGKKRLESGAWLTAGAGVGLGRGVGVAPLRLFLGGGFGHTPASGTVDGDGDGIPDSRDRCPTEPETKNGHLDGDGCPDTLVPVSVVVRQGGQVRLGARVDVSGDGQTRQLVTSDPPQVVTATPGSTWKAKAAAGSCLSGEGEVVATAPTSELVVEVSARRETTVAWSIVDDATGRPLPGAVVTWEQTAEACAPEAALSWSEAQRSQKVGAGRHRAFVTATGYATADVLVEVPASGEVAQAVRLHAAQTRLTGDRIEILDKVYFEFDSDIIDARSYTLLNEVAAVIMSHPEIGRVEVGGHTDSDGADDYNLTLSEKRAQAVRNYLLSRGVPEARVSAVGYGEGRPIEANDSAEHKALNRRVEFRLVGG